MDQLIDEEEFEVDEILFRIKVSNGQDMYLVSILCECQCLTFKRRLSIKYIYVIIYLCIHFIIHFLFCF